MNRYDLKNYLDNADYIKDRQCTLEEKRISLNKMTASYEENPGSSTEVNDKMAEELAKFLDDFKDTLEEINKMNDIQKQVVENIKKIGNKKYRNLLYKKYILGLDLKSVAVDWEIDTHYMDTLHGYALNEFDKLCGV